MKPNNRTKPITLEKGQIWKLEDTHIEIVALGKSLTHYKRYFSLKQKGVPTKLEKTTTVENYLRNKGATLVKAISA